MLIKWVAQLGCKHTIGGQNTVVPEVGEKSWCGECNDLREVTGIVTDEPIRASGV